MTLLRALAPLLREAEILYLTWARAELDPLHRDLPAVVRRLNELQRQRPRTEHKPRSRCEMSALCAHDAACPDHHCPGYPHDSAAMALDQREGGIQFRGGIAWPIERKAA